MVTFLTILHVMVCLFLILVVLLQAGKGGGMGIAFGGSGGSQTVFGSSGAGNFLTRLTSITATIFLVTSLWLAHYSSQQDSKRLQRLAVQKDVEKKADDDRANKLKQEIEKARQSAQKPSTTPGTGTSAPAATTPATAPASPASATTEKTGEPAAPAKKKKHSADSESEGQTATESPKAEKAARASKAETPPKPAKTETAPPAAP